EERARQKKLAQIKELEAEFNLRIRRIIAGQTHLNGQGERDGYFEATLAVLVQYLQLHDHPMSRPGVPRAPMQADGVIKSYKQAQEIPPGGSQELTMRVHRICGGKTQPGWRGRCGEALIEHALNLPAIVTRDHLMFVVLSAGSPLDHWT